MCRESGFIGLTDRREQGAASRKEHNEEAALAERLRPITQLLPLFSPSRLCFSLSALSSPLTFPLLALSRSLL